jgi:hypothetical protein
MAPEGLAAFIATLSGTGEPLRGAPVVFKLRHFSLLVVARSSVACDSSGGSDLSNTVSALD